MKNKLNESLPPFLRRIGARKESKSATSKGLFAEQADRIVDDLRNHWLRNLMLLALAVAFVWPVVWFINSVSSDYVKAQRDRLQGENEIANRALREAQKQVLELEVRLASAPKPAREPQATKKSIVKPAMVEPPKQAQAAPMERPKQAQVASTDAPKQEQLAQIDPPKQTTPITKKGIGDAPSADQVTNRESCAKARAHLAALQRIAGIQKTGTMWHFEANEAQTHIAAIGLLLGRDPSLAKLAEDLTGYMGYEGVGRTHGFAMGVYDARCSDQEPFVESDSAKQQCGVVARIRSSLKTLKDQTEAETILTSKAHLVASFNRLLGEAKQGIRNDQFISKMENAANDSGFMLDQKHLLFKIDILSERLLSLSTVCSTP